MSAVDSLSSTCLALLVDLSSWEQKIQRDAVAERQDAEHPEDGVDSVLMEHQSDAAMEMSSSSQELYKDGVLTLGCIGTNLTPHCSQSQWMLVNSSRQTAPDCCKSPICRC